MTSRDKNQPRETAGTPVDRPSASVVVLNWNGRQHLDACLSSLCRQTYTDREIILLDNGSTDGSPDYVRSTFPDVEVVHLEENVGPVAGLNACVRHARGTFIGLMNNDTEVDPTWLSESVNALLSNPEAGFTATRMRLYYRRTVLDTAGDLLFRSGCPAKRGRHHLDGPEYDEDAWIFGACAGAAVYRRTVFEDVGLFDEDFAGALDDLDLSFRAQLMGYRCRYVASAIVYHKVGATEGSILNTSQLHYRVHRNRWFSLIKNLPTSLWPRYLGQILLAEAMMLAGAARHRRIGLFLRARVDVLRHLPGLLAKRHRIQGRRRVTAAYIDSLISHNWLAHLKAEKQRESLLAPTGSITTSPGA
jgi:GT2 family glycosyltransferase